MNLGLKLLQFKHELNLGIESTHVANCFFEVNFGRTLLFELIKLIFDTKTLESHFAQHIDLFIFICFFLLSQLVVLQIFLITEHLKGVVEHDALQLIKRWYTKMGQESLPKLLVFYHFFSHYHQIFSFTTGCNIQNEGL